MIINFIKQQSLTHISNFPGKNLSGILTAYIMAPTIYRTAIKNSQPRDALFTACQKPSVITKCSAGITPLRPNDINTPVVTKQSHFHIITVPSLFVVCTSVALALLAFIKTNYLKVPSFNPATNLHIYTAHRNPTHCQLKLHVILNWDENNNYDDDGDDQVTKIICVLMLFVKECIQ